ncbi:MAG: response regulator transcription factor [Thermodesulfobacteriota bacterium]|nr:response regulator transcription factor [Thermodesulfobacteriota bacterium]
MVPYPMTPYRIVLADDHMMFRQGVKRIIEEIPGFEVVGEVGDGIKILEVLKKSAPDMILLDISMPNLRGIEATREIKRAYPNIKVLILTMHKSKEYLYHALSAGAEGYLLKEDADKELVSAIGALRKGKIYISPLLSMELPADLLHKYMGREFKPPFEPLSIREREVLKLIAEGKSSKEIAHLLRISIRTVHHHRDNIMNKLNIRKTAEIVKYAIQKGFTSTTN